MLEWDAEWWGGYKSVEPANCVGKMSESRNVKNRWWVTSSRRNSPYAIHCALARPSKHNRATSHVYRPLIHIDTHYACLLRGRQATLENFYILGFGMKRVGTSETSAIQYISNTMSSRRWRSLHRDTTVNTTNKMQVYRLIYYS